MSDYEKIQALKEIFDKAKISSRRPSGKLENLYFHSDLVGAIIKVGEEKLYDLKNELLIYLSDQCPELRSEAVQSLGWDTGFNDKEFQKNEAYQIWLNDPSEDVRRVALVAWARYHAFSKNPIVLKHLYNIFRSEEYSNDIRAHALKKFMDVADEDYYPGEAIRILELGEIEDKKTFLASMDWGKINRIMDQYVPNWRK